MTPPTPEIAFYVTEKHLGQRDGTEWGWELRTPLTQKVLAKSPNSDYRNQSDVVQDIISLLGFLGLLDEKIMIIHNGRILDR